MPKMVFIERDGNRKEVEAVLAGADIAGLKPTPETGGEEPIAERKAQTSNAEEKKEYDPRPGDLEAEGGFAY